MLVLLLFVRSFVLYLYLILKLERGTLVWQKHLIYRNETSIQYFFAKLTTRSAFYVDIYVCLHVWINFESL